MTIERKKEIRNNRAALIEAHQNNNRPTDTVNALIASIGYDAAAEIIAVMVNVKGIWDQRISTKNRAWAAEIAADFLGNDFVYYCDEIHPAHMDQIADAMRKAERPAEAPEEETEPEETAQEKTDRENREHCKRIAEELEAYAEDSLYRCPSCGEVIPWSNAQYSDETNLYTCQHCHDTFDADDLEALSIIDFLGDALDIEYRIGSDGEYRSVKIMVAFGGPNIYIDTASRLVTLHWWTDYAEYPISSDACDALDEYMEEYWRCM